MNWYHYFQIFRQLRCQLMSTSIFFFSSPIAGWATGWSVPSTETSSHQRQSFEAGGGWLVFAQVANLSWIGRRLNEESKTKAGSQAPEKRSFEKWHGCGVKHGRRRRKSTADRSGSPEPKEAHGGILQSSRNSTTIDFPEFHSVLLLFLEFLEANEKAPLRRRALRCPIILGMLWFEWNLKRETRI